jgi:hypothetical protein
MDFSITFFSEKKKKRKTIPRIKKKFETTFTVRFMFRKLIILGITKY